MFFFIIVLRIINRVSFYTKVTGAETLATAHIRYMWYIKYNIKKEKHVKLQDKTRKTRKVAGYLKTNK